jgi:hypothetical protein
VHLSSEILFSENFRLSKNNFYLHQLADSIAEKIAINKESKLLELDFEMMNLSRIHDIIFWISE